MIDEADPAWMRFLPAPLRAWLSGRTGFFAFVHNSGWLLLDNLLRVVLGVLVGAWVTRYLGPAQFGELAYVIAYIAFFQVAANLGMDSIIVRDIARDRDQAGEILGTAFVLRLAAGSFCWIAAVVGMLLVNGWSDRSVWLTALVGGALVFQASGVIDLWFQSQSQSRRTVFVKLAAILLSSGVKIALILTHASLVAIAAVTVLDAISVAVGLGIAYRHFPCGQNWQRIVSRGRQLMLESWPLIISGMSVIIYMRIDQIMIGSILGIDKLGIYAAALPLAGALNFIPMMLSISLMPFISRIYQNDRAKYETTLIIIFRVFFYSAISMSVMVGLLSDKIVLLLYGAEFQDAGKILRVYVFSSCFTWLGIAHSLWVINEKRTKVRLYGTLAGAVTCVVLNFLLIPKYGIIVSAWIAIITQAISAVGINAVVARESFALQMRAIFVFKGSLFA